jgi:hypothetical protein
MKMSASDSWGVHPLFGERSNPTAELGIQRGRKADNAVRFNEDL